MRDSMTHRGPDDAGNFVAGEIGLGFRRLSIIDLASGHQPMDNEDGSIRLIFNGEIYNYRELRSYLLEKGHVFRTKADTEVIVHLYEELGEDFVDRLNGMFAIAIWDSTRKKLVLARDRVGEKPLYYTRTSGHFYFASEIKAFLAVREIPKILREELLPEFLAFGNVYGESTLLRGICELLPGHILVLQGAESRVRQYWDPNYVPNDDISEASAKSQLKNLLSESVDMRLMSDVPLGAFLSGGVDSSLTVALMTQLMKHPVETFSVGFANEYSELPYASQVATLLHTNHHELVIDEQTFFESIPRLIYSQDEPINHSSAVPLHLLAAFAKRQGVTVLLSGEGGDELFAGYSSYAAMLRDLALRRLLPAPLWRMASGPLDTLGFQKHSKIVERYSGSVEDLIFGTQSILSKKDLGRLIARTDFRADYFFSLLSRSDYSPLSKILYAHLKTRLVSLLMKQDKMTMAASLEVRVPFLDHRIVRLAASMPDQLKIRNGEGKYILKKVAEEFLPRNIIYRQKAGFPVPLAAWFKKPNRFTEVLMEERTLDRGLFDRDTTARIVERHKQGEHDYSSTIWNMVNLEIWARLFLDGDSLEHYAPSPLVAAS
jgi:asparagine synthase (glutamine-hydrolysing)